MVSGLLGKQVPQQWGCEFDPRAFRLMEYNFDNFFVETVANFTRCEIPDRDPDYVSFTGSTYWDDGDRVIRWSDHWGKNISTCCWYLEFKELSLKYPLCGYCYYEDFRHKRNLLDDDIDQSS